MDDSSSTAEASMSDPQAFPGRTTFSAPDLVLDSQSSSTTAAQIQIPERLHVHLIYLTLVLLYALSAGLFGHGTMTAKLKFVLFGMLSQKISPCKAIGGLNLLKNDMVLQLELLHSCMWTWMMSLASRVGVLEPIRIG